LLIVSDWKYKYDGFIAGQWSLSSTDTLLLLIAIILFIPIWIFGSMILYKTNWSLPKFTKIREKNFKSKLVLKQQDGNSSRLKMPIKLKIQSSGISPLATQNQQTPTTFNNNTASSDFVIETIEKSTENTENIANQILQYAQQYQAEGFLNLNLDGIQVPLALSTSDETALLITIINEPNSFLTADINDNINADWFSTLGPISSPVKQILQATDKLKGLENDASIIPIIVLAGGELSDCKSVAEVLNKNGVILTRFDQGKPEALETINEFLDRILQRENNLE
jgi:hypothetical protein